MPWDPFDLLGLASTATAADVHAARRRMSKVLHPDAGGTESEMQDLNAAARDALASIDQRASPAWRRTSRTPRSNRSDDERSTVTDHPSFTIEALPVEAYEGLLVVASWIGEVVDDDPPYRLETLLVEPGSCWCTLELVPEAGSTSVGLTVAAQAGQHLPDTDSVRDTWVSNLNRLDWDDLDSAPQRPS